MNMLERIKGLVNKSTDQLITWAEVKSNPDLLGMNAIAGAFALLVMADRDVEEEEMEAVSNYMIDNIDIVIEKNLIREISEMFLEKVDRLERGYKKGAFEGNIVVGEILKEISAIRDDREYRTIVRDTVTLVTSGQGVDPREVQTRDRILKVLD